MLESISKVGSVISKKEQKSIHGGEILIRCRRGECPVFLNGRVVACYQCSAS
ncbi:hypothetical protein [Aquimarina sediminis]|uniref:hypothetical protein n=1 Tax=Aquimarina sediminis TaxID=2070536 RepID=UPI0013E89B72|nr:hypothetical protein [Aquimarina sediminis]